MDPIGPGTADLDAHLRLVRAQVRVREVFQALHKHNRMRLLYGAHHAQARRFREAFEERFLEFLRDFDQLHVEVEPNQLTFLGHGILGVKDHAEDFVYGLYVEGVRGISATREASVREVGRLADILSRDWLRRSELDDDLLTATWRSEFEHVFIEVADRFTEEEGEGGDRDSSDIWMGTGAGGQGAGLRGDSVLVPELVGLIRELEREAPAEGATRIGQDEFQLLQALREDLPDAFDEREDSTTVDLATLGSREEQALAAEIARIERGEDCPPGVIGEVVFELVRLEPRSDVQREAGRAVARHVRDLLVSGGAGRAGPLVSRVLCLFEEDLYGERRREAFLEGFSDLVADAGWVGVLDRQDRSGPDAEELRGVLFSVLAVLPRTSSRELVRLGASLERMDLLQALADALAYQLGGEIDPLLEELDAAPGDAAAVPLLALGRVEGGRATSAALARLVSDSPRIREAALRALRRQRSPRVREEVVRMLDDPAETVRLEALRYVAVHREELARERLQARIRGDLLAGCGEREVRAWCTAWAVVAGPDAVELLEAIGEGRLQGPDAPESLRSEAVRALVRFGGRPGRAAADRLARHRPEVRPVVRAALQERGKR